MTTGSGRETTPVTADQLRALIPSDWRAAIEGTLADSALQDLARRLSAEQEEDVFPDREQWFRALCETRLSAVRIVIIGQDPYQTRGLAEGLAFSVPTECLNVPPSLRRILREAALVATIAPGRTSLVPWAKQGVLLLNTALTVPKGKPGGHAKEWRPVTGAILRAVGSQAGPVAFMAWGTRARAAIDRAEIVDGQPHIVSASVHPMERRGSFIASNPFGCVKDRLSAARVHDGIDWSLG